ncbi:hypothetical protein PRABACTJOHN_00450 [Parabacteroides johnsonii DSM 18315]|uniref:Uncharacterized protein n=1 Tax=Parabacteroides johnsonii DSM 18315 TaxID=537006 RepID=B7B606_9BACT|nr:hypothetical protein PRABACTJOHN_00450 [Parabacteroides johnsonii DSM 18315]
MLVFCRLDASVICFRHCRVYIRRCQKYIRHCRKYTRQCRKQITLAQNRKNIMKKS